VTDDVPIMSLGIAAPASVGFRHTRWLLATFYALAVAWGVRNAWFWLPSGLDLLVPVALWVALSWWAILDAKSRGYAIPVLSQQWFFLFVWILVPVYVVWSRGWRGVGYLALHSALWMAVATLTMHAVGLLAFGNEWVRAFQG